MVPNHNHMAIMIGHSTLHCKVILILLFTIEFSFYVPVESFYKKLVHL